MAKTINLQREGKCAGCGAVLPVGASARYYGPGRIYGNECHEDTRSEGQKLEDSQLATVKRRAYIANRQEAS